MLILKKILKASRLVCCTSWSVRSQEEERQIKSSSREAVRPSTALSSDPGRAGVGDRASPGRRARAPTLGGTRSLAATDGLAQGPKPGFQCAQSQPGLRWSARPLPSKGKSGSSREEGRGIVWTPESPHHFHIIIWHSAHKWHSIRGHVGDSEPRKKQTQK